MRWWGVSSRVVAAVAVLGALLVAVPAASAAVTQIGSYGVAGNGTYMAAGSVAVDGSGNVFVLDPQSPSRLVALAARRRLNGAGRARRAR